MSNPWEYQEDEVAAAAPPSTLDGILQQSGHPPPQEKVYKLKPIIKRLLKEQGDHWIHKADLNIKHFIECAEKSESDIEGLRGSGGTAINSSLDEWILLEDDIDSKNRIWVKKIYLNEIEHIVKFTEAGQLGIHISRAAEGMPMRIIDVVSGGQADNMGLKYLAEGQAELLRIDGGGRGGGWSIKLTDMSYADARKHLESVVESSTRPVEILFKVPQQYEEVTLDEPAEKKQRTFSIGGGRKKKSLKRKSRRKRKTKTKAKRKKQSRKRRRKSKKPNKKGSKKKKN